MPRVVALAARCATRSTRRIPIPNNFTGHIRAVLADGSVVEERQPHMRGGAHEPLTRGDIEEKFVLNAPPRRLGRRAHGAGAGAAADAL